ncbi:MAG: exopolysaccharide biosynthesis polyprenyl glycosylphosphotransferase [Opitutaceae bacterium]|nr:exopolysaccharide biosynthesis polyprenyl glycosylphosphotransferase [Opitutaceae bacterium]
MISQRLRGLVNFHVASTTTVAMLGFLSYANIIRWLPYGDISPDVVLTPYLLCVAGGMIVAGRSVLQVGSRFHRLTWVDAAQMAFRQVVCVALLIFALMFATKDRAISRIFLGSYLCWLWVLLLFVNQILPQMLSRLLFQKIHQIPTLFIGTEGQFGKLKNWLASRQVLGIQPVGYLGEHGMEIKPGMEAPFLGTVHDLPTLIEKKMVAQVIVLSMPDSAELSRFILETCQERGCRLLIYSNLAEKLQHPLISVIEEGHTFYSLQEEPLEDPINRVVKRLFDIAFSLPVVAFILPPLCLWVWLMQTIQAPGKLLFVQKRAGLRRNEFHIFKFRSMRETPPASAGEAVQARKGDDRIYPFGHFLRKSSLDEFPQFLNVLRGEMSIVGPRPHMPVHDAEFSRYYKSYRTRHFAKPGITGLAQTRGFRGEITNPSLLEQRVQSDIYYIANWSFWLDVQITLKTVWQVIRPPKTAY